MEQQQPVLELIDVHKRFDAPSGLASPEVLRGVSMLLDAGQSISIVGPSGAGKSTLLNIIGSLDRPSSGTVAIRGRDLAGLKDDELARLRSREVGFVFQLHHLLAQCTALENVLIPTLATGRDAAQCRRSATRLLERVELGDRMDYRPGMLSGGERQRVAVARALVNGPRLLLADEPTGSLDSASADSLAELLVQLNREGGVTLIVVTHCESLARRMARRYTLRDGVLGEADPKQ